MLKSLLNLFGGEDAPRPGADLSRAVAALLARAAWQDGVVTESERAMIESLLMRTFGFDAAKAEAQAQAGIARADEALEMSRDVHAVVQGYSHEERIALMEGLWETVYADGARDAEEAQLMRRMSALLGLSDRESGTARKAALARLGLDAGT
jgi:uncharacterized tellurite resistance protein B-like protein